MIHKILVSACLLGQPVRYDGRARTCEADHIAIWRAAGRIVPICPELAAGLPVPRPPAEIGGSAGGAAVLAGVAHVIEADGADVTALYLAGAHRALALARETGCRYALLADGSPSCGSSLTYDGSFSGRRIAGEGVTAALLRSAGVLVFADHQIAVLASRIVHDEQG